MRNDELIALLDQTPHHPLMEEITSIICDKTQNQDRVFYRIVVAYYFAKMAASMRAVVMTKDRNDIPINYYGLACATSGYGKGYSVYLMENEFIPHFRARFMKETFPLIAEQNLWKLATERAVSSGMEEKDEKAKLDRQFLEEGPVSFGYSDASDAAIKQARRKLILANIGAINFEVDEVGDNIGALEGMMKVFFELYDQGLTKDRRLKNSKENQQAEELFGKTPANVFLFGTPDRLFDGDMTEKTMLGYLRAGAARRCFFAWGEKDVPLPDPDGAAMLYAKAIQPHNTLRVDAIANDFTQLADPACFGQEIELQDAEGIAFAAYKIWCQLRAREMEDHEDILKTEMEHRHYKCLKLAGVFAFVDQSPMITPEHAFAAMKLTEESGQSFARMLAQDKNHIRLARFIAGKKTGLTHADIAENLPFYTQSVRKDLMMLACAWGYKNNILIRRNTVDSIELFTGETLEKTDLNQMTLSWSDNVAFHYKPETVPFEALSDFVTTDGLHWANHWFKDEHRTNENAIEGFNMVVIDSDGEITIPLAQEILAPYVYLMHTTKRHGEDGKDRFRIILPINHRLRLDKDDYKEFMNNLLDWLPFKSDESTNQRNKKWLTTGGAQSVTNMDGMLLDALRFLPRTSRNDEHQEEMSKLHSLNAFERWFVANTASGNRSNMLIRYALALVDNGMGFKDIEIATIALDKKLKQPLGAAEIQGTIMKTVSKRLADSGRAAA